MKNHTYTGVDIFKVFAAMGVVAIHSGAIVFNTMGRLGVPFFAIISSFFFFKKYLDLKKNEKETYLISYLKRIFYLYLVWQIIYLPLAIKRIEDYKKNGSFLTINWGKFIWRFIFPGYGYTFSGKFIAGTNGWGVSWYLIGLLMGLPLFCLAIKYIRNNYIIGMICVVLEVAYICSSGYHFATNFFMWGILTFLRLFIYLFIGYIISQNIYRVNQSSLTVVVIFSFVLIILFLFENFIVYKFSDNIASEELITTVPTSTVITVLALKINPEWRWTRFARNYSTFLYTSQIIYLSIFHHLAIFTGIVNGYFALFATIILSFITFLIYAFIRKKLKWHWLYYMV